MGFKKKLKAEYNLYCDILYTFIKVIERNRKDSSVLENYNKSFLIRFFNVIRYLFSMIFNDIIFLFNAKVKIKDKDLIAHVVSHNNFMSLIFLKSYFGDRVSFYTSSPIISNNYNVHRWNTNRKGLYYYKYPMIWLSFFMNKKNIALKYPDLLFHATGFYEYFNGVLKNNSIQCIIFSNDINIDSRSLLLAAKENTVNTVYLQHAVTSDLFPPLKFDLSLLEGEASLANYKKCGAISGEVRLIGMAKFDKYLSFRKKGIDKIKYVGVCINLGDNIEVIRELIKNIKLELPQIIITFRPHPRMSLGSNINHSYDIYSNPREEQVFDFLAKQDALISGDSSILLEGTLMNLMAIYFDSRNKFDDYYRFVELGLADVAYNFDEIKNVLMFGEVAPDHYLKAKPFNEVLGTKNEGKSSVLVVNAIKDLIS